MKKEDIFNELKKILSTEFEIDENLITPDAELRESLNLDSIDAIDLFVKMKEYIPADKGYIDPMILRNVHTVQDVVDALFPYISDEQFAAFKNKKAAEAQSTMSDSKKEDTDKTEN